MDCMVRGEGRFIVQLAVNLHMNVKGMQQIAWRVYRPDWSLKRLNQIKTSLKELLTDSPFLSEKLKVMS